jgi:large subunit ribosomal protein L6
MDGNFVEISGPKGTIRQEITSGIKVNIDDSKKMILVERSGESGDLRARHGLYRAIIANMVAGVVKPYEGRLEIVGVGYNAKLQAKDALLINIGFCHPVKIALPAGITAECPKPINIVIRGADKALVGQITANIRAIRPPEPYNGKGIRYEGEAVRRKAGKTFVGGT